MPRLGNYRNKETGHVVRAMQYGAPSKMWEMAWITEVRNFVTGIDVDTRTTITNEQVLDVVNPVLTGWNVDIGIADLNIAEPKTGRVFTIRLLDWIVDNGYGEFAHLEQNRFFDFYEQVVPDNLPKEQQEFENLANFIYNECMVTLDGELYQALAEGIAGKLLAAGWKKGTS